MRRAARVDGNHTALVYSLRLCGYVVQDTSRVGGGFPDLLVGTPWNDLVMVEVKDGAKPPSGRKLTLDQRAWHLMWSRFPVLVVTGIADAIAQLTERHARRQR